MNKRFCFHRVAIPAVLGGVIAPAFAVGPDLSSLTGAVDLSTVGTGILAVAALLMAPRVIKYAAQSIMKMFPK